MNASEPILLTLSGILITCKLGQFRKASSLICTIPSGKVTFLKLPQFSKHAFPMALTGDSIIHSANVVPLTCDPKRVKNPFAVYLS